MSQDLANHIIDLLSPWGTVTARRMFGGYGIYHRGLMFGLISDGTFYLKVDDSNRSDYQATNSEPFTYETKTKRVSLSHWQAPAEIMEDEEELCEWAKKAYAAAIRCKK